MLSANEQLRAKWEDTDQKLAKCRLPYQERWTNAEYAQGEVISSNELIRRIRNLNPCIWAEDSRAVPGQLGFYYESPKTWQRTFTGAHFPKGMVRQRVLTRTDRADLITGYELGWQQVVNRLLKLRLISWRKVQKMFPTFETELSKEFYWQARDYKD